MKDALIEATRDNLDFYPTPDMLIEKLLSHINLKDDACFLEPAAGSGNIVKKLYDTATKLGRYGVTIDVDCIEIDSRLQHILRGEGYRVVFDDFLRFHTFKKYDAIIMNPPFSNGDEHLLKAIELQKNGGKIICILNAETIKNPYTNRRKILIRQLEKYEANIEFFSEEFQNAERKTSVDIALIVISIPKMKKDSFIFENLKKAKEENIKGSDPKEIVSGDYLEQIIDMYNFEVEGTLKLVEEYEAIRPYINTSLDQKTSYNYPIVTLCVDSKTNDLRGDFNFKKYMETVRMKYWSALFSNKEFTGNLTSNLQKKYHNLVNEMANYDFCIFNIKQVQKKMENELIQGLQDTILDLFDKLSADHSWYPETKNNIHYYDGWATNKAHKVNNKKVILPINGFHSYSWKKNELDDYHIISIMSDLEKSFSYLDDGNTLQIGIKGAIERAAYEGKTKNIQLRFFDITFYKKGTCHIRFNHPELVDKLNIYAARNRKWLPPYYGKKTYDEMNQEEQTVIDNFQGKEAYEKVMSKPEYYLSTGTEMLMLENR